LFSFDSLDDLSVGAARLSETSFESEGLKRRGERLRMTLFLKGRVAGDGDGGEIDGSAATLESGSTTSRLTC
jgi:hypothetical protein